LRSLRSPSHTHLTLPPHSLRALAVTYPDEKNKKTPSEAVAHIVKLHKGLSQLSQEYPWIVALLEEILLGGLHRNKAVSTKLECLSESDARRIGKILPQALRARKTAEGGVYQWMRQNPSMVELFEKHPWVKEMVETMGEEVRASGERLERGALARRQSPANPQFVLATSEASAQKRLR
jgi:hypothetical protein